MTRPPGLLVSALLLAGCGSGTGPTSTNPPPPPPATSPTPATPPPVAALGTGECASFLQIAREACDREEGRACLAGGPAEACSAARTACAQRFEAVAPACQAEAEPRCAAIRERLESTCGVEAWRRAQSECRDASLGFGTWCRFGTGKHWMFKTLACASAPRLLEGCQEGCSDAQCNAACDGAAKRKCDEALIALHGYEKWRRGRR